MTGRAVLSSSCGFARLQRPMSPFGPSRTSRHVRFMSALGSEADSICSVRDFPRGRRG
jgi:hypothetical protein